MPDHVRVRFAPSPTGLLHIGGLRTALYNYAFARRHGGTFVLRIEDTDRERFVAEAEPDILKSLRWAGLDFDEGPGKETDRGPYRQSERTAIYRRYAEQLVEQGHAYSAFDTVEELEELRNRNGGTARYDMATRTTMRNALSLGVDEARRRIEGGEPHVIRLKVPEGDRVTFDDAVRGSVAFEASELDDQVLVKSDGMPTYHLANVIDDHLMGITHVIRGEEWLPSTPKHILLYRFFGWEAPRMAHLPLILSPNGGKLSKRNATELGIPVSVHQYREAGYEPEALLNFLAFLGWNPGDEREMFTLEGLVEAFSLDRVGSSGVRFSMDKLRWFNEQHLRALPLDELVDRAVPALEAGGIRSERPYLLRVAELMQERISFASDLATEARYFFEDPAEYDAGGVKKRWKADSAALVTAYAEGLRQVEPFSADGAEDVLRRIAEEREVGAGRIIHPTRLAVSGVSHGPSLFHMMEVIGRDACIRRMQRAAEVLG